jgi:hypothetical protein
MILVSILSDKDNPASVQHPRLCAEPNASKIHGEYIPTAMHCPTIRCVFRIVVSPSLHLLPSSNPTPAFFRSSGYAH